MSIAQTTTLPLKYGKFAIAYHKTAKGDCVSVYYGDLQESVPIVRFHSSCLFGESFHGLDCDCADQLTSTLKLIKQNKSGVVVYRYNEGRGIGLETKIRALELQKVKKLNTVEAFELLGFKPDIRAYDVELLALKDLKVNQTVKAATQNPRKLAALREGGFVLSEQVHPEVRVTKYNLQELMTKKALLGHNINLENRII